MESNNKGRKPFNKFNKRQDGAGHGRSQGSSFKGRKFRSNSGNGAGGDDCGHGFRKSGEGSDDGRGRKPRRFSDRDNGASFRGGSRSGGHKSFGAPRRDGDSRGSFGGSRDGRNNDRRRSFEDSKEGGSRDCRRSFGKPNERRDGENRRSFGGSRDGRNNNRRRSFGDSNERDNREGRRPYGKRDGDNRRSFGGGSRDGRNNDRRRSFGDSNEGDNREGRRPYGKRDGDNRRSFNGHRGERDNGGRRSFGGPRDRRSSDRRDSFDITREGRHFDERKDHFKTDEGDNSDKKTPFDRPKREGARSARPKTLRQFEEEDLSFGKKTKKLEPVEDKKAEPEVTFSKELENKWETPEPEHFKRRERRDDRKDRHHHEPKRSRGERDGFLSYFEGDEEQPKKVFDSHRNLSASRNEQSSEPSSNTLEGEMPLNKFIAHCDVCSRRDAAQLVKDGKIKVNDNLVTEPGFKVTAADKIEYKDTILKLQKNRIYILLNKPKGYITTTDDPKGRRIVMDLFKDKIEERIFPIGRLDRNTTGLLLLTNDGDFSQTLAHPSHEVRKIYQATLNEPLKPEDFEKIKAGLILEDGPAPVDELAYLEHENEIGLEIHNGRNRIVRRIFESLGYQVEKLDRVMYANLTKKDLPRGHWRFLSKQEVINLKYLKG